MQIDYKSELNAAQYDAVMHDEGPLLVIAGAGSGKTRTVVYRLARLVEQGVAPESILLLTFTRKAAGEMLFRAGGLLGYGLGGVSGGTFHSFAYGVLKRHHLLLGFERGFSITDRSDCTQLVADAKSNLGLGKGDRSFPKKDTVLDILSKSRNKEANVGTIIQNEAFHLLPYVEDMERMAVEYARLKKESCLLDYDDLLFELERLLRDEPDVAVSLRSRFSHIMVDEYQDTNRVQARIVKLLTGGRGNVMAVGDDAQSIYAFRGAVVANILDFPSEFPGAKIVRLERNYRSTQEVLDLANAVLANAQRKFEKRLYTEHTGGAMPEVVKTLSDQSQSRLVLEKIIELNKRYEMHEIAVLFRAGYQSYSLEVQLNKLGIAFQKFGGIKFTEAAHVKDALAFMRVQINPADSVAWKRVLGHIKGVGPKTADKIVQAAISGDGKALGRFTKRFAELMPMLEFLNQLRMDNPKPEASLGRIIEFYTPLLMAAYPDDYPRRQQGLEQLESISAQYSECDQFLAEINLDNPMEDAEEIRKNALVLSTIHSAKGLEWDAVLILDLVEERFPGRRAMQRPEDMEEERRLMYVAATRARKFLGMYVPESLYVRHLERSEPVRPSPFVLELPPLTYVEYKEGYGGRLQRPVQAQIDKPSGAGSMNAVSSASSGNSSESGGSGKDKAPVRLGFCHHKIYGRGKVLEYIPPDKYRVNFTGFGLKVIIGQYLEME
ncbi:MAG: ATP-dependent helicase [Desulfovibrio sp.]|uniref:ATP-dependent helicase n=1 Tax=Desulfovibrio sp. 7SRBS1 TaxID=3378064 RepID=UPI003B3E1F5A